MTTEEKINEREQQIFANQQKVIYDTYEFTIETIVNKYKLIENADDDDQSGINEIYVLSDYQQKSAWDKEEQSKFIESVILGFPIPVISLVENIDTKRLEIANGAKRIITLSAFLNNELQLSKLDVLSHLEGCYFKDLTVQRQRKFKKTTIRTTVFYQKNTDKIQKTMQFFFNMD